MSIREQILNDIKTAMKEKNEFERDALRTINAAIKQIEVDERKEMTDEIVLTILQKEVKKRNDSASLYKKGGRDDLAQKEEAEIALIARYLPKQLSDDELKSKLTAIIGELNASSLKELGMVVKTAKATIGASADAKRISEMAKSMLS
ncbi:MAG: GatB/YqeY domain-containing protein [Campylobacter sp.]|nr:GatB/YqeY domain-containing protein [Campylobacter sp.]